MPRGHRSEATRKRPQMIYRQVKSWPDFTFSMHGRQSPRVGKPPREVISGSMRQISDMLSTPENGNASTCGFFTRKGQCSPRFRNLPHTSVLRIRKCGEKTEICRPDPSFAVTRPAVLLQKLGLCSALTDFSPHFRNSHINGEVRTSPV